MSSLQRVGFTGTQDGMSDAQKRFLREILKGASELHHGDCVGADAEADAIARELGVAVIVHPPSDPKKRAYCAKPGDVVWEPLPYLERNRDIVESATLVVAAPRTNSEELRSGTWSTVRYAKKIARALVILARDD